MSLNLKLFFRLPPSGHVLWHSLSGDLPGVWVCVCDALLDGVLQDGHVLLQARGRPRVQQLVKELAAVTPDLLGLKGDGSLRIIITTHYKLIQPKR